MHRVLAISEVLDVIFQFTTTSADASCAQVSKGWKEEALNALWFRIDKLHAFLYALGSVTRDASGSLELRNTFVTLEQWDHFATYANRVRSVDLTNHHSSAGLRSLTIIGSLGRTEPIFPNLRHLALGSLELAESLPLVQLFLHKALQRLSITVATFSDEQQSATCKFFPYITRYAPNLTHLRIRCSHKFFQRYHGALAKFMPTLPKLVSVELPPNAVIFYLPLKGALTTLSHLKTLLCYTDEGPATIDPRPGVPHLLNARFPCLTELSLRYDLTSIQRILQSSFTSSRLTKLHVIYGDSDPDTSFAGFMRVVGQMCTGLVDLSVVQASTGHILPSRVRRGDLTSAMLIPLTSCRNLVHFKLHTADTVKFFRKDMLPIIQSWSLLQVCEIRYRPLSLGTCLSFGDLRKFARLCPDLEELTLRVCFTSAPNRSSRVSFKHLRKLRLSLCSGIYDIPDCALYLAELTSPYCDFDRDPNEDVTVIPSASTFTSPTSVEPGLLTNVINIIPSMRTIHGRHQQEIRQYQLAGVESLQRIRKLEERLQQLEVVDQVSVQDTSKSAEAPIAESVAQDDPILQDSPTSADADAAGATTATSGSNA